MRCCDYSSSSARRLIVLSDLVSETHILEVCSLDVLRTNRCWGKPSSGKLHSQFPDSEPILL